MAGATRMCGQEWEGGGAQQSQVVSGRLAGGLLRSDLEGVEAVVVLDGADPEGVKATQYLLTPLMRTTDESLGPDWLVPVAG
jgi:hypothetical protein